MKRKICLLLVLALIAMCCCAFAGCNHDENAPKEFADDEKVSTTMEKPEGKTPSDVSATESLYIAAGELQRSGGFSSVTTGASTSLGISQNIATQRTVIGQNVFKQSTTYSVFVKKGEQYYITDDNYFVRTAEKVTAIDNVVWSDTAEKYSAEAYGELIGYRGDGLTGYILNDYTITSGVLESCENGIYTFRYVLDVEKAPYYLLYEMRHNAGSDRFATFSKAEIVVTMDENFVVKTLTTDCEYKASAMGLTDVPCTESLTETFTMGVASELPQTAFFKQFFNSDSIDTTGETEKTAINVLTAMMNDYLINGKVLNAQVTATYSKTEVLNADVSITLDAENLTNSTVVAQIGDLNIRYTDGRILVNYMDFCGSLEVNEALNWLKQFLGEDQTSSVSDSFTLDTEEIAKTMTFDIKDGVARVNIPFTLGTLQVEVNFYAYVNDGEYTFRNVVVGADSFRLYLTPQSDWILPEFEGEYPDILTVLEEIDKSAFQTEIFGTTAQLLPNISMGEIYLQTDFLTATIADSVLYAQVGGAKLKADFDALEEIATIAAELSETSNEAALPDIDVTLQTLLSAIKDITAKKTSDGVVFALELDDTLGFEIRLSQNSDCWSFKKIIARVGENTFELTPCEAFEPTSVGDKADYADVGDIADLFGTSVRSLAEAETLGGNFEVALQLDGKSCTLTGEYLVETSENPDFDIDFALSLSQKTIEGRITYIGGNCYITLGKFNFRIAADDIGNVGAGINLPIEVADSELQAVITKLEAIVSKITDGLTPGEIASLAGKMEVGESALKLIICGGLFELNDFDLELAPDGETICAKICNLTVEGATADITATIAKTESKISVNAKDYTDDLTELALSAKVEGAVTGKVTLGNTVCDVSATVLTHKGNVQTEAQIKADGVDVVTLSATIFDGVAYIEIDECRFAMKLDDVGTESAETIFAMLKGKNEYLDQIFGYAEEISEKIENGELSAESLLNKIVIGDDVTLVLNGEELCIGELSVSLTEEDVTAKIGDFAYKDIKADFDAKANLTEKYFGKPNGDWNSYFVTNLDDNNTLSVCLDTLNGELTLKLQNLRAESEPLYIRYLFDEGVALVLKGDTKVRMNSDDIAALLAEIQKLSTDADDSAIAADIESILSELSIDFSVDADKNKACATISASGIEALLTLSTTLGKTKVYSVKVTAGETSLCFYPCKAFETPNFGIIENYANVTPTVQSLISSAKWLANATTFGGRFGATVISDGETYVLNGEFVCDLSENGKAFEISFTLNNGETKYTGDIILKEGTLYLTWNDVRFAMQMSADDTDLGDITSLPVEIRNDRLQSLLESLQEVLNKAKELSVWDIVSMPQALTVSGEDLEIDISGELLGLDDFSIGLTAQPNGFTADIEGAFENAEIYAVATLCESDCYIEIDGDYITDPLQLLLAQNFETTLKGKFTAGENTFDFTAALLRNTNGNLAIDLQLALDGVNAVNLKYIQIGNIAYVELDGVRFAFEIGETESDTDVDFSQIATALRGKNEYFDQIFDYIDAVSQNLGDISVADIVKKLVVGDGCITLELNGELFFAESMSVTLSRDGVSAELNGIAYKDISADVSADAALSQRIVSADGDDWKTYFSVVIDENNTAFVCIDVLAGMLYVKVENTDDEQPLYVIYDVATETVYIAHGGIRLSGNLSDIAENAQYLDSLVKEFAGTDISASDIGKLLDIDLDTLLESISFAATADKTQNTVTATIAANDISAKVVVDGESVEIASIEVTFGSTTFTVTLCEAFELPVVNGDYVALDEVLNDYMPTIEALTQTHAWRFDFAEDSQIDIVDNQNKSTSYLIAAGSYVEFYFNEAYPQDFALRANIVLKLREEDAWTDFVTLDIAIIDGRIYVTYNDTLKCTVSLAALVSCADLVDELRETVPQLDELLEALADARNNLPSAGDIDYTALVKAVSYDKQTSLFAITLNGSVFSEKLGDIVLSVTRTENTMTLENMQITYENMTLNLNGVTVAVSEETEPAEGETFANDYEKYVVANEIHNYTTERGDESEHISFDSVRTLLRAFIDTAKENTFSIDGTVSATIDLGLYEPQIPLGVTAKVDIDDDGYVYVSIKIVRENSKLLGMSIFADKGGNSYLNYNGKTGTVTVIRDSLQDVEVTNTVDEEYSYCTKCSKEAATTCKLFHKKYLETRTRQVEQTTTETQLVENDYHCVLTAEEFCTDMENQIFEMLNFGTILGIDIEQTLRDATAESGDESDFTTVDALKNLQNILKNYEYVTNADSDNCFELQLDLAPVDQNFGVLNLNIGHTTVVTTENEEISEKLRLTCLNGDFTIASIVKLDIALQLDSEPIYGEATDSVENEIHW